MKVNFSAAFLILICKTSLVNGIEPVSTVLGVTAITVAGVSLLFKPLYCRKFECCDERSIKNTVPQLRASLDGSVYGQHLAVDAVVSSINGHMKYRPPKALVLSLQGWTGTGKNLVAKLIAENIYPTKGLRSKYVHVLSATKHFARQDETNLYKDQIRNWVIGNITDCPHQLFIFDEVEKMPDGVLNVLKPFLDHYESLQGVDYRKAIYLFLGNAGGKLLFRSTLDHYVSGKKREKLELKDIETTLWKNAYNDKGGLKGSSLISSNLISHYVPFLPLERDHVIKCIRDDLKSKNFSSLAYTNPENFESIITETLAQIEFTPDATPLYSQSGCKRVFEKVNYVLEKHFGF